MAQQAKTITIHWRDENYGRVSGSVAFRSEVEPYPSDTAHSKLVRAYKRHGFEVDHSRAAWIAVRKPEDMPVRLSEDLEKLGYQVTHAGCVPACLDPAPAPGL